MSSIIGIIGIIYGIHYVFTAPVEGFHGYYDKSAIVLLGIVPPSIMLLSHKISDFKLGISVLLKSIFNNTRTEQLHVINMLSICAARVRTEGIGSLMHERKRVKYELMIDGLSLIINNFTSDEIRHNLEAKINAKQGEISLSSNLFENLSKLCPGVGMLGTLMGLIAMMSKLSDPAAIGSGMALALVTTLFGLFLGTVIYGPFGAKVAIEGEKIYELDLLVLEGILALKEKKSSVHLKDIMKTYSKQKGTHVEKQPA